tara:strand:- start:72 stop:668 length:597 start_codon:yes stop_codon:yes gene_type:complete
MWLPKIKIKKPDKSQIGEIVDEAGNALIGGFFETFKGQFFSGDKPSSKSKLLRDVDKAETNTLTNQPNPVKQEFNPPTEKELLNGDFKRYFIRDKRNGNIAETTKAKYQNFVPKLYLEIIAVDWILTPPAKDVYFNGMKFEGAETKNKKAIEEISKTFEGLDQYIQNYSEFVPESNISGDKTTPPAESNTTFDLPSPS